MSSRHETLRKAVVEIKDPYTLGKFLFYNQLVRELAELFIRWHAEDRTVDRRALATVMERIHTACLNEECPILKEMRSTDDPDRFQILLSVLVGGHVATVLRPALVEFSTTLSVESITEALVSEGKDREVLSSIVQYNALIEGFLAAR